MRVEFDLGHFEVKDYSLLGNKYSDNLAALA